MYKWNGKCLQLFIRCVQEGSKSIRLSENHYLHSGRGIRNQLSGEWMALLLYNEWRKLEQTKQAKKTNCARVQKEAI